MSSRAVVRSATPRVRRAPRSATNEVEDATFLASSYGLRPDDWQEDVLESWLGRRRDGRWSAATCGLAVPRQNGKNGIIEVRELFGMVALGEKFLHTAHEVKTARKAFLRIASFFENERQYPELAALVKDIRKTNGQEAVILHNGGSVEFIARSKGSGRGFTVDVLVCDEAQDQTNEELEALLPTISASPLGNPQVIFTGTPPKPDGVQGEVFRTVRADGEANRDARLAWTDFGAPDGPLPDIDDTEAWARHNPALGIRLNVAEVERERALMASNPEGFAKERLGWWGDPKAAVQALLPNWSSCATTNQLPDQPEALGLAVSIDQQWVSIAAVGMVNDKFFLGAAVPRMAGTADLVETLVAELARMQNENGMIPVAIDKRGPAAYLIPTLEDADIVLEIVDTADYLSACSELFDSVARGDLLHGDHPDLNTAVKNATKRTVGDRWAWARKNGDISMLEAATLARWTADLVRNSVLIG